MNLNKLFVLSSSYCAFYDSFWCSTILVAREPKIPVFHAFN